VKTSAGLVHWCGSILASFSPHPSNFLGQLHLLPGCLNLPRPLKIRSSEKLRKPNLGKMRIHRIKNVNNPLAILPTKVLLENIGAKDIVDGNPTMTSTSSGRSPSASRSRRLRSKQHPGRERRRSQKSCCSGVREERADTSTSTSNTSRSPCRMGSDSPPAAGPHQHHQAEQGCPPTQPKECIWH